jgi:hypothetical protein
MTNADRARARAADACAATLLVLTMHALGCGSHADGGGLLAPQNDAAPTSGDAAPSASDDSGGGDTNPPPFMDTPSDGGPIPLQARIQANETDAVCGACSVILAQVQGGTAPYTYVWSDPSFDGPGPFQVCPDTPTQYSVQVTDSSSMGSGEIVRPSATVKATVHLTCTPGTSTAQDELLGCQLLSTGGTDGGVTVAADSGVSGVKECFDQEVEAGVALTDGGAVSATAARLPWVLHQGHAYQLNFDRLLPITFGQPVQVDIFGSNEPDVCAAQQKFGTLTLDGSIFSWHESVCFTPDRDYRDVLVRVYIQGVQFYFNVLAAGTMCSSCSTL